MGSSKGKRKKKKIEPEPEPEPDPDLLVEPPHRTPEQEIEEQAVRDDVLAKTVRFFDKLENQRLLDELEQEEKAKWKQYLKCDGLPDPRDVKALNTYLQIWTEVISVFDDKELKRKCEEALPLLDALEQIQQKETWYTQRQLDNFAEARTNIREALGMTLEETTYYLMSDIEGRLQRESVEKATFELVANGLKINFFTPVAPPHTITTEESVIEPLELSFPLLQLTAKLPVSILEHEPISMRAVLFTVDLFSEYSSSFYRPPIADESKDFYAYTLDEYIYVSRLFAERNQMHHKFRTATKARIREIEKMMRQNPNAKWKNEKEELERLAEAEPPPTVHPWVNAWRYESRIFEQYLVDCKPQMGEFEVNLRKYCMIGGIIYMDVYNLPPQPKYVERGVCMTTTLLPKKLRHVTFKDDYRPPPPYEPPEPDPENPDAAVELRDPEAIEAEMREIEAQYEKLILINIDLSKEIIWCEPPLVAQWSDENKTWTTRYINDLKYNEDKFTLAFRTGVLWPVGIAVPKYSNLPFQGFEIKPDPDSDGKSVLVTIVGIYVTLKLAARLKTLKLLSVVGPTSEIGGLDKHIDKAYNVNQLVTILKNCGVDMFPWYDAHNDIEGTCAKVWPMESHLYKCMALLSNAYEFQFSRWNKEAGRRGIVFKAREAVDKKRESLFNLFHVSPLCTSILQLTENSLEYSDEPMVGVKFYPDLLALNSGVGSSAAKRAVGPRKCLADLLLKLKLFSFS